MMLLPRKQFRNASFGFRGPRDATVVPSNEGGGPHCQTPNKFCGHITLWQALGAFIISPPTTPHLNSIPLLRTPARLLGLGLMMMGMTVCCLVQYLRHAWAPTASMGTYGIHGHLRHPWAPAASVGICSSTALSTDSSFTSSPGLFLPEQQTPPVRTSERSRGITMS